MDPARQNSISALVIEDDATQTKLNLFVKSLKDLGLDDLEIKNISVNVATSATNQTTVKISLLMNDEDFGKWKKFMDSTPMPNTAQQIIVMNEYLKNRVGKDLETLHLEILDALVKDTYDQLVYRKNLAIKASQLSDNEVDEVNKALDAKDYDKAEQIMNKLNNSQL